MKNIKKTYIIATAMLATAVTVAIGSNATGIARSTGSMLTTLSDSDSITTDFGKFADTFSNDSDKADFSAEPVLRSQRKEA